MTLNEDLVRKVVEEVVAQLSAAGVGGSGGQVRTSGAAGIYGSVDDAVAAATEAFGKFQRCTIDQRKRATGKIREICIQQSELLGKMELDETKIGRLDHKIEKLVVCGERTPGVEFLKSELVGGDRGLCITEHAPFGVIAAITPVTHSLPTLASNAIQMLASGNAVVFNAHPSGSNIARHGVKIFNEAIRAEIGIDNLLTIVDPPTIESAQKLFDHRDVKLLVVTGGPAVARAALSSKKRAIVAGPGNPPVVVDETACLERAALSIIQGGAYDNNLLCIGEKEVFAVHSIFDKLLSAMASRGGHRLSDQQVRDLEQAVFAKADDGSGKTVLRKDFVGKDPHVLGKAIGVNVPGGIDLLYGETGENSPFVDHEQMMPFVPFVRVANANEGIDLARKYEHGYRHTAIIHTRNMETATKMGREMDVTLFVMNAPSMAALGSGGEGHLSFSIATPTGEGVTSPLTFTRQRRVSVVDSLRVL